MRIYSAEFTLLICGAIFGWFYANTDIPTFACAALFTFVAATQFPQVLKKLRKVIEYLKSKNHTSRARNLSLHLSRALNFALIALISGGVFYFSKLLPEQTGSVITDFPFLDIVKKISSATSVGFSLSSMWIYIHAVRLYSKAMLNTKIED